MQALSWRLGVPALLLLMCSLGAQAELAKINLLMTATLVAFSCDVSASSTDQVVNMGSWSSRQFTPASPSAAPVHFTIDLENCSDLTRGISVTFNGDASTATPTLLALKGNNTARNVAIAILDENRSLIPLGQAFRTPDLGSGRRSAALTFYSQYRATGAPVTPGTANADATFTMSYE